MKKKNERNMSGSCKGNMTLDMIVISSHNEKSCSNLSLNMRLQYLSNYIRKKKENILKIKYIISAITNIIIAIIICALNYILYYITYIIYEKIVEKMNTIKNK